jgi:DNA-binding transcriptional regulator YiaG
MLSVSFLSLNEFVIDNTVYRMIQSAMSPKQILAIRKSLKLTQQQLADRIGAQRHTVARWETGVNEPKGAYLKALNELAIKAKRKERKGGRNARKI